jgi:hypothetical protein
MAIWAEKSKECKAITPAHNVWKNRMPLQQYWARAPGLYRYMPAREFAQAYRHSAAGEAQIRALRSEFQPCGDADSALAWTKYALTGMHCSSYRTCSEVTRSTLMGMLEVLTSIKCVHNND